MWKAAEGDTAQTHLWSLRYLAPQKEGNIEGEENVWGQSQIVREWNTSLSYFSECTVIHYKTDEMQAKPYVWISGCIDGFHNGVKLLLEKKNE